MKNLPKIIAVISIATLAAASVMSFSGSAAQNTIYNDPSGDGIIDISDAIAIRQYLAGGITPQNVDALDFDNNGVVTQMDADKVQLYLVGLLPKESNSGVFGSPAAVSPQGNSSASYCVFNAKTGVELTSKNYTLTASPEYNNARVVIGDTDDRVIDWSKSGVVKIMTSNDYIGTGFVVGDHTIATAAHCVFDKSNNSTKSVSSIKLFDNDGNNILDVVPKEFHVPKSYIDYPYTVIFNYDYALITVDEDLSDYMQFDLGTVLNYSSNRNISITATGFPKYYYNSDDSKIIVNTNQNHNIYSATGPVTEINQRYFNYSADISDGDSGGPVYYTETINGKTYYTVIGIVSSDNNETKTNSATRITTEIIRFYNYNDNIN